MGIESLKDLCIIYELCKGECVMKRIIMMMIFTSTLVVSQLVFAMNMSCDFNDIGGMGWPPDDAFGDTGFLSNKLTITQGNNFNGRGYLGNGNDKLYAKWGSNNNVKGERVFLLLGGIDDNKMVKVDPSLHGGRTFIINNDNGQTMYMIIRCTSFIAQYNVQLISCNDKGKWFSYFDSFDAIKNYGHWSKAGNVLKSVKVLNDCIELTYNTSKRINTGYPVKYVPVEYKITYKWDDGANWFSVEHSEMVIGTTNYSYDIECISSRISKRVKLWSVSIGREGISYHNL